MGLLDQFSKKEKDVIEDILDESEIEITRDFLKSISKATENAFSGNNLVVLAACASRDLDILGLALRYRHAEGKGSIATLRYVKRKGKVKPELHVHTGAVKKNSWLPSRIYSLMEKYMSIVGCEGTVDSIVGEENNIITFCGLNLSDISAMVGNNADALNYSPSRTPNAKNFRRLKYARELPVVFKVGMFSFLTDYYSNESKVASHKVIDTCGSAIFNHPTYRMQDSVYSFLADYYSQSETHCNLFKISPDRWRNFKKSLVAVQNLFKNHNLTSVNLCTAIANSGVTSLPLVSMRDSVTGDTRLGLEQFVYLWASCLVIGTKTRSSHKDLEIDDAIDERQSSVFYKFLEKDGLYPSQLRELKTSLMEIWKSNQFRDIDDIDVEVDEDGFPVESKQKEDISFNDLHNRLEALETPLDKAVVLASLTSEQQKSLAMYTYNIREVLETVSLSDSESCTRYLFRIFCPQLEPQLESEDVVEDVPPMSKETVKEQEEETQVFDALVLRSNLMQTGYPLEAMAMLSDPMVKTLLDNTEKK